jgi:uncharacterized protein YbaA (DUF1428 family)
MPRYVDGFILVLPKRNLAAYRSLARKASRIWREHGALEYRECVGEEMVPSFGLPFPRLTRCRRGETVVFSWIGYRSKAHRNRVNARVMKDPRIAGMCDPEHMPFDVKRMAYGGFEVMVGY